ncbi:MAG: hypothetical protein ACP5RV_09700, partial [Thiomonas sp.]
KTKTHWTPRKSHPQGDEIIQAFYDKKRLISTTYATFTAALLTDSGVVLGGIYTSQEQNQTDKVPLLGDIPVVGNLFKSKSKMYNKNELMVFLTPKIVTNADLAR